MWVVRKVSLWYYGVMAVRKMTFSLPEDLAAKLLKRVPSRDRSRFLAQALEKSLREDDESLIRSCLLANEDPEVQAIEQEWDAMRDPIEEPWSGAPSR